VISDLIGIYPNRGSSITLQASLPVRFPATPPAIDIDIDCHIRAESRQQSGFRRTGNVVRPFIATSVPSQLP